MSEQHCAARKALEEILNVLGTGECGVNNCGGCAVETQEAIALAREALAAPCEHTAEDQVSEGRRDALFQKSDELRAEWQRAEKAEAERDQLRAELEKAQALNHRWNRATSQHGPCGSEFHDDPERVFARVLEARQFASEVARVKAEKRANTEKRAELDTLKAERQEIARVLEPFAKAWNTTALVFNAMMPFRVLCSIAEGDAWKKIAELHASLAQEKPEVPR